MTRRLRLVAGLAAACAALAALAPAAGASSGLNLADRDTTCAPCQDFYQYATGGWRARTELPASESTWGSFDVLAERTRIVLRGILEKAAAGGGTADARKIGDFYAAAMDSAGIEAAGLTPLRGELDAIAAVKSSGELPALVARLHNDGVGVFYGFGSGQDAKHSAEVIAQAMQGGLGLPDRDYYFKTDPNTQKIRDGYRDYVSKLFALAGSSPQVASQAAETVMRLETRLAAASRTRVERRDPVKNYNKMSTGDLAKLTPHYAWATYFRAVGAPAFDSVNVGQPDFFSVLDSMVGATPVDDWKTYCTARLLDANAGRLPSAFVDASFDFRGRIIEGTEVNLPRWRRALASTDRALGEVLGKVYVEQNFPPAAKTRMQQMVADLVQAFREDIQSLDWMSDATKTAALGKLATFTPKIGYPDKWRNYDGLAVTRGSWVTNALASNKFDNAYDLAKIGKPVDRLEWGMTPPTINAYYNAGKNEIVFPAGILQPPFFDMHADDAVNYGAIGVVIGHEMSHGFDDRGRKFDAQGNLNEWWNADDKAKFDQRAACVEQEYASFTIQDSLHMQGKLVLGEALADLGGSRLALRALDIALKRKPQAVIDGYTPYQRFYLGFAAIWAEVNRPEAERLQIATDPHPLGRFRVNGTVVNNPAFAEAFKCPAGAAMTKSDADRCRIW